MAEITNARGKYNLDFLMIPSEYVGNFNDFMEQYGELSDRELFREIAVTKTKVSRQVLDQHINNLNALSQMQGFVNESTKQRIGLVKHVLTTDTGASNSRSHVETQFWGGSSLLLWFLTLAAIWRRSFRGIGRNPWFGGGFY